MSAEEFLDLNDDDLDLLVQDTERLLPPERAALVRALVHTLRRVFQWLEDDKLTIRGLLRMLFGPRSEKLRRILDKRRRPGAGTGKPPVSTTPTDGTATTPPTGASPGPAKKKRRGHGHLASDAYTGAQHIAVPHPCLKSGDPCPNNDGGKVYPIRSSPLVRITANTPVSATIFDRERLRCNVCDATFTAPPPPNASPTKYDDSVAPTVAFFRYGMGMPFKRMETLQGQGGVPLPASNQWELVLPLANIAQHPVRVMIRAAAQLPLFHNDDTPMRILSAPASPNYQDILDRSAPTCDVTKAVDTSPDRKSRAVHTTSILARAPQRTIALFVTGRHIAGENLQTLLQSRLDDLPTPLQMCDALSHNLTPKFQLILAHCLAHGRRPFVNLIDTFPEPCTTVLTWLAEVFHHDELAAQQNLAPDQRLLFHQTHSAPVMAQLRAWIDLQFAEHRVEPNSRLGKALRYLIRHWQPLTLFLRQPGAPLDNNLCERALKMAIRHRKNSLFYKSPRGAWVGDIFMSLIHTCCLNHIAPLPYLRALAQHSDEVHLHPERWLPWNYTDAIKAPGDTS